MNSKVVGTPTQESGSSTSDKREHVDEQEPLEIGEVEEELDDWWPFDYYLTEPANDDEQEPSWVADESTHHHRHHQVRVRFSCCCVHIFE